MKFSFTNDVVNALLGDNKSNLPAEDLDVVKVIEQTNTIYVKNNKRDDSNTYKLITQNKNQMKSLIDLLYSDKKPNSILLKNNYTSSGQYLEFTNKNDYMALFIDVIL